MHHDQSIKNKQVSTSYIQFTSVVYKTVTLVDNFWNPVIIGIQSSWGTSLNWCLFLNVKLPFFFSILYSPTAHQKFICYLYLLDTQESTILTLWYRANISEFLV